MGLVEAEIPGAAARESMRGQCLGFGPEIRNGSHFGFILHERAVRYGSLPGRLGPEFARFFGVFGRKTLFF